MLEVTCFPEGMKFVCTALRRSSRPWVSKHGWPLPADTVHRVLLPSPLRPPSVFSSACHLPSLSTWKPCMRNASVFYFSPSFIFTIFPFFLPFPSISSSSFYLFFRFITFILLLLSLLFTFPFFYIFLFSSRPFFSFTLRFDPCNRIRNPTKSGSWNPESTMMESGIRNPDLIWNPESNEFRIRNPDGWNPESRTSVDSVTWVD